MKIGVLKNILENRNFGKIIWEWKLWKLNLRIGILEIKFERYWNFENYLRMKSLKLNLKVGVLENDLKMEFWKLNLRIGILEIKFERNWNFEDCLRIGVLKVKFKNWKFGN